MNLEPSTIAAFIRPGEDADDPNVQGQIALRYMRARYDIGEERVREIARETVAEALAAVIERTRRNR